MYAVAIHALGVALCIAGLLQDAAAQSGGQLTLTVAGVRNGNGAVRCGLYSSPDAFPKPGEQFRGTVAHIKDQQATCVFAGVPAGTYAIAFFHAEQNESQLTYGAFGKPQQGYGFSNNASSLFGAPSFSAAAFSYAGGTEHLRASLNY
jgi:uncharacterized protein (DUF2141 family)